MSDSEQALDPAKRVDARPEKRFFIYMLTKDIELVPAIVDLVDNSVDGARGLRGSGSLDGLRVDIDATPMKFSITDNCGGLPVETARDYAFRFGRPEAFESIPGSVGQFGVGMKRAIFKLGKDVSIRSVASSSSFDMRIDVDEWAAREEGNWSFAFGDIGPGSSVDDEQGLSIEVTRLIPGVSEAFERSETIARLRNSISTRHLDALSRGLRVTVNGDVVRARMPVLLQSDLIHPIHYKKDINPEGEPVELTVIAGIAPSTVGDDKVDEGHAQLFTEPGDAGWYLFCNGRLVIAADRTVLTGWGSAGPAYHPQYRRFRGYAYLDAANASLLPWNTTKTGVDEDTQIFRRTQQEMFRALQAVVSAINAAKDERQRSEDVEGPLSSALATATPVVVNALSTSDTFVRPAARPRPKAAPRTITIQYPVDRKHAQAVQDALGVNSAREAGKRTFFYYYENEIGEIDGDEA